MERDFTTTLVLSMLIEMTVEAVRCIRILLNLMNFVSFCIILEMM